MILYRSELKQDLQKYRAAKINAQADVERLSGELEEAKRTLSWAKQMERAIAERLHTLDGEERNCTHRFKSEPSGRGIGFDSVCSKCGWCENFEPMY